jgi:hypothetical protein
VIRGSDLDVWSSGKRHLSSAQCDLDKERDTAGSILSCVLIILAPRRTSSIVVLSCIRSMGLLKKSIKALVVGAGDVRQRFADDYLGPDVALVAEICLPPQAQQALQFPELSFERA